MQKTIFDTIVIGSGIGGLSSASLLTRKGLNVLLCEKMNEIGGYLNNFTRTGISGDKYTFDTGVHYIGGCMEGGFTSGCLEEAVGETSKGLKWNMVDPEKINRYIYNDFEYRFPLGLSNFVKLLSYKFPDAKETIHKTFEIVDDIEKTFDKVGRITENIERKSFLGKMRAISRVVPLIPKLKKYTTKTSREILSDVSDYRILKILESFGGECGVNLEEGSSVLLFLLKMYSHGAFYPHGGTRALINIFRDTILKNGGTIKKNAGVTAIRKQGDLFKIQTNKGEFTSKTVISNTDAKVLYSDLLPQEMVSQKIRKKIQNTVPSASNFYTFVGTDLDLSKYMTSGNVSLFDQNFFDEKLFSKLGFNCYFMSSPTLKDPNGGHSAKGKYSLEILSDAGDFGDWEQWKNSKPYQRPIEYIKKKEEIGWKVLKLIEQKFLPNLTSHLDFVEFASPLTNLHYVSAPNGSIYGPAQIPSQNYMNFFPMQTKIPGLYHCGSSTYFGGIPSCLKTGIDAAKKLLKYYKK
ncbi:hypothetical protein M0812_03280 [Anaeramoeba flamelloides]|uniref:Amine oxidase domain-containing protein n=1 Tax=Anaeramoeba flamelloides TaxID=1746091 RepID=A0AAV8AB70_9EUKA|nr:hypothetical protein M0812_03280 [Anaeramoeba flamelloides]